MKPIKYTSPFQILNTGITFSDYHILNVNNYIPNVNSTSQNEVITILT